MIPDTPAVFSTGTVTAPPRHAPAHRHHPRHDDRLHTVVEGDRLDLLAHRYLGDARLWWIICDYNDLFFPLALDPGLALRIPSREHVQMRLLD